MRRALLRLDVLERPALARLSAALVAGILGLVLLVAGSAALASRTPSKTAAAALALLLLATTVLWVTRAAGDRVLNPPAVSLFPVVALPVGVAVWASGGAQTLLFPLLMLTAIATAIGARPRPVAWAGVACLSGYLAGTFASSPVAASAPIIGARTATLLAATGVGLLFARIQEHRIALLERRGEEVAQGTALRDELVAVVAHELRTPVTAAIGLLDTVTRNPHGLTSEERRDFLTRANRQLVHLKTLVSRVLEVAGGLQDNAATVRPAQVDLAALFADCQAVLTRSISTLVDPEAHTLITDREALATVIGNLLENAVAHSPPEGRITLSACSVPGGVQIAVRDGGPGIPAGERRRIFEPFFQVERSSTRTSRGLGLGLYIVSRTVAALGGRVWVEDPPGGGSEFIVFLPHRAAFPHAAAS